MNVHAVLKKVFRQEIRWCRANKGISGESKDYERGFIAGLNQAIYLTDLSKQIKNEYEIESEMRIRGTVK